MSEVEWTMLKETPNEFRFLVRCRDGGRVYRYRVTLDRAEKNRNFPGMRPEAVIQAAFRYLLRREPPSAILPEFHIRQIEDFFPGALAEIAEEGRQLPSEQ